MEQSERIPSLVRTSLSELERLSSSLGKSSSYSTESTIARSHLSKLKLWSGCLGAHRVGGTRSLSYRLRDASSIRQTVLFLLENLERYVKEAEALAQQDPVEHSNEEDAEDSTDEELAEYFRNSDSDGPSDNAELKQVLSQMEDVLDCLMRLAITISNPAPYDQFRSRAGVFPYPYQWDIAHVRQKLPGTDPVISERLGKALTQRRRYFKYREEHHLRLQEGLNGDDDDDNGSKGKVTTMASSLPHEYKDTVAAAPEDAEDIYSEVSTTSYATTSADQGQLRIPPIPKDYRSGPFLCPFCYMLISVDAESDWKARLEWKKHVYRDLHPYVCLEKDCTKANQDFQRRKQWALHMLKEHWRSWNCPFGCPLSFRDFNDARRHALEVHPGKISIERVEDLVTLSSNADPRCAECKCPLCLTFDIKNSQIYESHVGRHLEQLALFVLPQISEDDNDQDESTEDDQLIDWDINSGEELASDVASDAGNGALPKPELQTENDFGSHEDLAIIYDAPRTSGPCRVRDCSREKAFSLIEGERVYSPYCQEHLYDDPSEIWSALGVGSNNRGTMAFAAASYMQKIQNKDSNTSPKQTEEVPTYSATYADPNQKWTPRRRPSRGGKHVVEEPLIVYALDPDKVHPKVVPPSSNTLQTRSESEGVPGLGDEGEEEETLGEESEGVSGGGEMEEGGN